MTSEEKLEQMLKDSGVNKRGSYRRSEVCRMLGFSQRTYWKYVSTHEPHPETDEGLSPWTLDSFMMAGESRVRHGELVSWLGRNRTYERKHALDTQTMSLPGFG